MFQLHRPQLVLLRFGGSSICEYMNGALGYVPKNEIEQAVNFHRALTNLMVCIARA